MAPLFFPPLQLPQTQRQSPTLALRIESSAQCAGTSAGRVGMGVRSNGSNVIVVTVKQGGPACVFGVKVGDVLLAVANEIHVGDDCEPVWVDVSRFSEGQLPLLMAGFFVKPRICFAVCASTYIHTYIHM